MEMVTWNHDGYFILVISITVMCVLTSGGPIQLLADTIHITIPSCRYDTITIHNTI